MACQGIEHNPFYPMSKHVWYLAGLSKTFSHLNAAPFALVTFQAIIHLHLFGGLHRYKTKQGEANIQPEAIYGKGVSSEASG